ncbi:unnamed protein product [Rotaria socialis]|uniref:Uncharacterized protein n=1 Tax=Rotaria socialis TaxID=392032 RepID=A0A818KNP8_9BILA|nr:unnamed protein product [Rotaria socialis]CAF4296093.1 unnamed protein product [Rotaria socialis]
MYQFIQLLLLLLTTVKSITSQQRQCQQITYYECKSIGYNQTYLPNKFNHQDQKDVALVINQFTALIAVGCSAELSFLLCSIYMPLCLANYSDPIPPCREVCERVRTPCEPFYSRYGFIWPDALKCEQYPSSEEKAICMDPKKNENRSLSKTLPRSQKKCCKCNTSIGYHLIEDYEDSTLSKCLPPCRSVYFSDKQSISIINIWLAVLSILCALSCTIVLLTFYLDMTRFKYPQRPIIFLSLCYFFVSCGYLIRLILGHENVACQLTNKIDSLTYTQLVRVSGPSSCTFVFVLTYFFGMASSIWWVILTLTWFLAAGFKWSSEAISYYSIYYHLIAWLLPSLQTVVILMRKGIDGDPIGGICYVGHTDSSMLRGFVLFPLVTFLTVGTIFLLAGLISLMRIRNVIKVQDRSKTNKLEQLMVKIGLFAILYTVPATFVIGIYFYELRYRSIWEDNLHCNKCPRLSVGLYSPWSMQPNFMIYMAKYFFLLIVGITTGLWINFNNKTLRTWKSFFCCEPIDKNIRQNYRRAQNRQRYDSSHNGRDASGINYSYKHTKINGSKYSLPSSKQGPLAHV